MEPVNIFRLGSDFLKVSLIEVLKKSVNSGGQNYWVFFATSEDHTGQWLEALWFCFQPPSDSLEYKGTCKGGCFKDTCIYWI